ncbi:MAG: tetratricopeptide repeat protein [Spirochaetia bacterium]|nr:tetratricopeptide repeat protein [Spirochaetia bacterium]
MKMKTVKKIYTSIVVSLLLFFLQFSLTACISSSNLVPGNSSAFKQNIYNEYYNIAEIYYSLEKYDKAVSYYELAMNNRKFKWDCYYKLGKIYVIQEKWDIALSVFQDLLKRDPDNYSLKSSIAYIYAMKGDTEKSLALYEELLEKQSDNIEFLENYIALLLLNEDCEKAQINIDRLENNNPDSKNLSAFKAKIEELQNKNNKEETALVNEDHSDADK